MQTDNCLEEGGGGGGGGLYSVVLYLLCSIYVDIAYVCIFINFINFFI